MSLVAGCRYSCRYMRKGLLKQRLDGQPGTYYLFRPDQHVVARWRNFDLQSVRDAVARATMQTG